MIFPSVPVIPSITIRLLTGNRFILYYPMMKGLSRPGPLALIAGAIALIAITIAILITARPAPSKTAASVPTGAIDRARDIECRSRLRILDNALQIYMTENGHPPEHLDQLAEVDPSAGYCPVTGKAYVYDVQTGRVTCPGH